MSSFSQILQHLDRFTADHPEIACAYLFGSAAGGRFTDASDIDIIRAKQDSIARCIGRIQSKANLSYEQLLEDYDAQDVITLNLERSVQQACDIEAMILAHSTEPPIDTPSP